jgi:hypothetical protein
MQRFSRLNGPKFVRTSFNFCAQRFDHAAHLPIAPFGNPQFEKRVFFRVANAAHGRRAGHAIGEFDAPCKLLKLVVAEQCRCFHQVGLGDVVLGVGQSLSELVIVGEKEQAGSIQIETPYRTNKLIDLGNQIVYRWTSLRIAVGRQVAFRFIEQNVAALRLLNGLAVQSDFVPIEIDSVVGSLDGFAMTRTRPVPIQLRASVRDPRPAFDRTRSRVFKRLWVGLVK